MPPRPTRNAEPQAGGAALARRYDLAVSTQCGDRPTFFAIVAGRRAVAPVEQTLNGRFKRAFLHRSTPYAAGVHRVEEILRLADLLGIARAPDVIAPRPRAVRACRATTPSSTPRPCSATSNGRSKAGARWPRRSTTAGLTVMATGGPAEAERRYLDAVWAGAAVQRLDGQLDWPQLAGLLAKARVYVGPDTSVTHLAAASRLSDRRALWPDRSAAVGPVAGGGPRRDLAGRRARPAPRQCLAGAEPAALPCRANWKAASGGSRATARVWMSCRRSGSSRRWRRRWKFEKAICRDLRNKPADRRQKPTAKQIANARRWPHPAAGGRAARQLIAARSARRARYAARSGLRPIAAVKFDQQRRHAHDADRQQDGMQGARGGHDERSRPGRITPC